MAHGGTLFLDEIGDLSMAAQAKILRALETRSFKKVGGTAEVETNVRILTATNVPLLDAVEQGVFRQDLFYRLNLFAIETAPLRERQEDIIPLATHFLSNFANARGRAHDGFSPEVLRALEIHEFPGNARELKNMVERAAIMSGFRRIEASHLNMYGGGLSTAPPKSPQSLPKDGNPEAHRIRDALEEAQWNRRVAAQNLKMPYSTLRYKIEKLGIK